MKFDLLSRKCCRALGPALILMAASSLAAQSVTVQVLNGKNGKPVGPGKRVYVAFQGTVTRNILNLHTDDQGKVEFDVEGAKTFRVVPTEYATCGEQAFDAPLKDYSVDEVLNDGLVTRNLCESNNGVAFDDRPQPGKLLYFVKRETWESYKNLN